MNPQVGPFVGSRSLQACRKPIGHLLVANPSPVCAASHFDNKDTVVVIGGSRVEQGCNDSAWHAACFDDPCGLKGPAEHPCAYPVFETEIDSFNLFNTLTLAAFTSAGSLVSLALGIWTSAMFSETMTPEGRIASKFIAPALCVAAIIAIGLGIWARHVRSTTWQQIKRESSSVTSATPPTTTSDTNA